MDKPSSSIRALARRLLALEAASQGVGDARVHEGVRVCEKLKTSLTRLAGADSFTSLLRRALVLARTEVPSLHDITVKADCSMDGLGKLARKDSTEATAALTAHLLWLLVTFIGEPLTMKLVREAWPDASVDEERS